MIRTQTNQNGEAVALSALNSDAGTLLAFTETASASTSILEPGVYLVSALDAAAFVRISATGAAGILAGSFPLPAGAATPIVIKTGQRIHARGVDAAGTLSIIPFENQ
ncbi:MULTISPECIES: hypothetical protein [unclassified Yoonia]|uniref:hypothetical protein n=1 Tax=unclassified Yoonia TaxID=2629118 RepID=UPI002AFE65DE|nr:MULTISPECIES: hypothetical protein [unclassified Yoonia]